MKCLLRPIIAIAVASLLLFCLSFVFDTVADKKALEEQEYVFSYLLMGSMSFEEEEYDGEDELIQRVFRGTNGYIVETKVPGYADDIVLWVGVKDSGYVSGITVRKMNETLGLGRKALYDVDYLKQYLKSEGGLVVGENIEALTGATVTSKAITKAVNSAVGFVTGADVVSSATEWGV